jgi:hypothetical protein
LIAWRLGVSGLVTGNLLALRVFHQVVSPAASSKVPGYRSEVSQALGLIPSRVPATRDVALMALLEDRAMRSDIGWRIAASYALLAPSRDHPAAALALTFVPHGDVAEPASALWRGRVVWAHGFKAEATRQWRVAFGAHAAQRKKLAETLYMAGEYLLAIDEAMDLLYVPDCGPSCRAVTFELLRYWIVWQGHSDAAVRELCDRILAGIRPNQRDAAIDRGVANILARRAYTLGATTPQAETELARAETLQNTPYVRTVRAYFVFQAGRADAAHQAALSAMRDAGSDGHALIMAGQTLLAVGDRTEARRAWSWTIQRDPLLAGIAQGLLDVYRDRGTSPGN